MTIHHDKLAYGKIASNQENLSDSQILEMLSIINAEEEEKKDKENENPSQES